MATQATPSPRPYDAFKRVADIIVSAVGIVVLSPVLLLLTVLVRVFLGSPVIFRQQRPGRDGKLFTMYKFRSMREFAGSADLAAVAATDAQRLTRFGRILRASSLDELPELFNVLVGDMSVIGPRPLLPEYLPLYNPRQAGRHEVRPGMTGWAQVNGRNAISWEERFELDVYYVEHRSLALDLRILWMSIAAVFKRTGVSSGTHATMEPFEGTKTPEREENT